MKSDCFSPLKGIARKWLEDAQIGEVDEPTTRRVVTEPRTPRHVPRFRGPMAKFRDVGIKTSRRRSFACVG